MLNSRSQASTNDNSTRNVDGKLRQATLAQNPMLPVVVLYYVFENQLFKK